MAKKGKERFMKHLKTIIILTALFMTACGQGITDADLISCRHMQTLQQQGLLPPTQAEQDALRLIFANTISEQTEMGTIAGIEFLQPCNF
jgi:hypothetical protein